MEATFLLQRIAVSFPQAPQPGMTLRQAQLADQSLSREISDVEWEAEGVKDRSLSWIQITDHTIRITHYMYFAEAGGFAPISRHLFPRARQPYFRKALRSMASSS